MNDDNLENNNINDLENHEVVIIFKKYYFEEKNEMYIAAIKALGEIIKNEKSETSFEFFINLKEAKDTLINFIKNNNIKNEIICQPHSKRITVFTIYSCCDIYHNFLVKKYLHNENNFNVIKNELLNSAYNFPNKIKEGLDIIQQNTYILFDNNNMNILTYSNSECVKQVLINANKKKKVNVYFSTCNDILKESYYEKDKKFDDEFIYELRKEKINVIIISLENVKDIFKKIDFVITGAEIVLDNGSIIAKNGLKYISKLCALNQKPFYVVCQAFKFLKINENKLYSTYNFNKENNLYDYIPNDLITCFYTDIGIFNPFIIPYEMNKFFINSANF